MRNAMAERTPDKSTYGWAVTQNNLAVALQALGTHEEDIQSLEESIPIYDATLKALDKETVPMIWAMVNANRASAMHALAAESDYVELALKSVSEFEAIAELFASVELTRYQQLAEERRDQAKELVSLYKFDLAELRSFMINTYSNVFCRHITGKCKLLNRSVRAH